MQMQQWPLAAAWQQQAPQDPPAQALHSAHDPDWRPDPLQYSQPHQPHQFSQQARMQALPLQPSAPSLQHQQQPQRPHGGGGAPAPHGIMPPGLMSYGQPSQGYHHHHHQQQQQHHEEQALYGAAAAERQLHAPPFGHAPPLERAAAPGGFATPRPDFRPPQQPYGVGTAFDAWPRPAPEGLGPGPSAMVDVGSDRLRGVRELPEAFQPLFSFKYFNLVQSECYDAVYGSDASMVVAAPTGSGKTGVMELAMLRLWGKRLDAAGQLQAAQGRGKAIYLAPIRALVQERHQDWSARFSPLGLSVLELSGDSDLEPRELEGADLICTTPEKFDHMSRQAKDAGSAGFLGDVALVLIDEVHLLQEGERGACLEAGVVCRLKMLSGMPEMAEAPIKLLRFVAVSATVPNAADIGTWLGAPPGMVRIYGDELRPVKLTTTVKGYPPSKNDFLFERRLNEHVFGVVAEHSKGRPALVFCSSRNSTTETAQAIAKEAQQRRGAGGGGPGGPFVRGGAQQQRLQQAVGATKNKTLQALLPWGVGFHNAAMDQDDRTLVEGLFREAAVVVLCTTSTLAMGVNLPAHLVVLKGTRRYVGARDAAAGEGSGYAEYTRHEVLQMVGRAGRPQFDTEGVAVIMTQRSTMQHYSQLAAGQEEVESCLLEAVGEHLNAEVVLGTVRDVSLAIAWLKTTFLYVRIRTNPGRYGLVLPPGTSQSEVDRILRDQLVLANVRTLVESGIMATDEEGFELRPTNAGRLMARHYVRLPTMVVLVKLPRQQSSMAALISALARADEFKNIILRRSEKKLLNTINHRPYAEGGCRFPVMEPPPAGGGGGGPGGGGGGGGGGAPRKVLARIQRPDEKIQILINEALSDRPGQGPGEALDYSLRQEQDQLLRVGQRLVRCMAKLFAAEGRLAAAGNAALLGRALRQRLWEDSAQQCRQLPNVGRLIGQRLQSAGFGSLAQLMAADPGRVELAAQRAYPFGATLQASARGLLPPAVQLRLRQLSGQGGGAAECEVTLVREDDVLGGDGGPGGATGRAAACGSADMAAALLVGCPGSDELLLHWIVRLRSFQSPMQLRVKVPPPPPGGAAAQPPAALLAALLPERISGADVTAHLPLQLPAQRGGGGGSTWQQVAAAGPRGAEGGAEPAAPQRAAQGGADGQRRKAPEAGSKRGGGEAGVQAPDAPSKRRKAQQKQPPALPPAAAEQRQVQPSQLWQPSDDTAGASEQTLGPSLAAGAAVIQGAGGAPHASGGRAAAGYGRFLLREDQGAPQPREAPAQQLLRGRAHAALTAAEGAAVLVTPPGGGGAGGKRPGAQAGLRPAAAPGDELPHSMLSVSGLAALEASAAYEEVGAESEMAASSVSCSTRGRVGPPAPAAAAGPTRAASLFEELYGGGDSGGATAADAAGAAAPPRGRVGSGTPGRQRRRREAPPLRPRRRSACPACWGAAWPAARPWSQASRARRGTGQLRQ
ncbi:MAG: hypothetical protein J3K34DRAFT_47254 [Monoraphidium minutum]|nr:MAG: hypothetical protein J3K34DRAFT_47254 [Monoraphidium minutum]